jgi:hypothetical protein
MSETGNRIMKAAKALETHLKRVDRWDTPFGVAVLRMKVNGKSAKLTGLDLTIPADAPTSMEAVRLAIEAFKRVAQCTPDSDGDLMDENQLRELEAAVDSLD